MKEGLVIGYIKSTFLLMLWDVNCIKFNENASNTVRKRKSVVIVYEYLSEKHDRSRGALKGEFWRIRSKSLPKKRESPYAAGHKQRSITKVKEPFSCKLLFKWLLGNFIAFSAKATQGCCSTTLACLVPLLAPLAVSVRLNRSLERNSIQRNFNSVEAIGDACRVQ